MLAVAIGRVRRWFCAVTRPTKLSTFVTLEDAHAEMLSKRINRGCLATAYNLSELEVGAEKMKENVQNGEALLERGEDGLANRHRGHRGF